MGAAAKKAGLRAVRIVGGILDLAVITAVLLLVAFSCYALWDSGQVYNAASAAQYQVYKPTGQDEGASFAELAALNPEVFAWLTVYGTNIDYPVTQAEDNWKYVSTNAKGEYSLSGSIFLDCDNSPDFSDFNSILYGHHMEKQSMFGELGLFAEEAYFNARPYGELYYEGQRHGLVFFAFLRVDAYDATVFTAAVEDEQTRGRYLGGLLERAIHTRGIEVSAADNIVLLSTCSPNSTNGREILVAKITSEIFDDPFAAGVAGDTQATGLASPHGWLAKLPRWALALFLALPVLLVVLLALAYRKKRRRLKLLHQKALASRQRLLAQRAELPAGEETPGKTEKQGE